MYKDDLNYYLWTIYEGVYHHHLWIYANESSWGAVVFVGGRKM